MYDASYVLKMPIDYVMERTPRELQILLDAHIDQIRQQEQVEWERLSFLAYYNLLPWGSGNQKPEDFNPLVLTEKQEAQMTPEQIRLEAKQAFKKYHKTNN